MARWPWGAAAVLFAWILAAIGLDTWGRTREQEGTYDLIVVAGCRVDPDGEPSAALEWRVRTAVTLWGDGVAPRIVFTGGVGDHPPAEAEAAAALAAELGVPAAAMGLESTSTSTEENAHFAAAAFPAERVLVVTDAYHVFRARRIFDRYYPEVDAVASPYGRWSRVRGALREVLAVGWHGAAGEL